MHTFLQKSNTTNSMGIDFKNFIKDIKKGVNYTSDKMSKVMPNSIKAADNDRQAVYSLMRKYYPSRTVVGRDTYDKRAKEFLRLYKQSGPKIVIDRAKKLHEQFRKNNPDYKN